MSSIMWMEIETISRTCSLGRRKFADHLRVVYVASVSRLHILAYRPHHTIRISDGVIVIQS